MKSRIDNLARAAVDQPRHIGAVIVKALRQGTRQAATYVAGAKTPVRKVATTGLRLNAISHKSLEKLVKHQLSTFEAAVEDGAQRLTAAAEADDLRALLSEQVARLPATRKRVVGEARKTLAILVDTGMELRDLVKAPRKTARKASKRTTKKTARKTARKAAPKAAVKAPVSRKPAARSATKASVVRRATAGAGRASGSAGPKAA